MNRRSLTLTLMIAATGAALAVQETNVTDGTITTVPANEPTVVTSERLRVDYAHNTGTFEGNVLAVDPRITARADKMTVFFASTNTVSDAATNTTRSVEKIVAEGAVVITTPDNKKATGERAEYTAADGKVVLTGHPQVQSRDGTVTGARITFWHGQDKMDVETDAADTNRTRLIIYPETQRKQSREEGGQAP